MTKLSPAASVCTRLNDAFLARSGGSGSFCPAIMVGWNKMLCLKPGLESHMALYAVSERKSSHAVPGFIKVVPDQGCGRLSGAPALNIYGRESPPSPSPYTLPHLHLSETNASSVVVEHCRICGVSLPECLSICVDSPRFT